MDDVSKTLGILAGRAVTRSTITYTALGNLLGLNMKARSDHAKLGQILNEVADYTFNEFGYVLPAIVVGKATNMPSGTANPLSPSGFYGWCNRAGIYGPAPGQAGSYGDPRKLVIDQQAKVFRALAPNS